jgi:uncharacterized protein YndB with AHSA1/START domain
MSETRYSYEHRIVIERPRNDVIEDFLDVDSYREWQPNLVAVEEQDPDPDNGAPRRILVFAGTGGTMRMEERVLEMSLPHKIIVEYRMGTTRNVQYNYFESFGAKTMWTVTTEFQFDTAPEADQETFQRSTKRGLELFKRYVESR